MKIFLILLIPSFLSALVPEKVVIVVNQNSPLSLQIAQYYQNKRKLPAENICSLVCPTEEIISLSVYEETIRKPLVKFLEGKEIDCLVLTKGVPLKIKEKGKGVISVDSALAYFKKVDFKFKANPYYGLEEGFSSAKFGCYLVTRLDGYNFLQIKNLINRGLVEEREEGVFVLDTCPRLDLEGGYGRANDWLRIAAAGLRQKGYAVVGARGEEKFFTEQKDILGYFSWGSNDELSPPSSYWRLEFVPGALAETYVSSSARTFNFKPAGGLHLYSKSQDTFFSFSSPSPEKQHLYDYPTAVVATEEFVWVGTRTNGLQIWDKKNKSIVKIITQADGLASNCVTSLIEEETAIWVGGIACPWENKGGGVNKIEKKTQQVTLTLTQNQGLISNSVRCLLKTSNLLIIGTDKGITFYDETNQNFSYLTFAQGLSSNDVRCLLLTESFLWIGTGQGLNKYHLGKSAIEKVYTEDDGLNSSIIQALGQDERHLWVGTAKGLNKFSWQTQTWESFTKPDYLIKNTVRSILVEEDFVWVGNGDIYKSGIVKFDQHHNVFVKYKTGENGLTGGYGGEEGSSWENWFFPNAISQDPVFSDLVWFALIKPGQSLIADLIAVGVTGVKGYVAEPYLEAMAKPAILFDRYLKGFSLAESFYLASPFIGWKDVVVGDPLVSLPPPEKRGER